MIRDFYYNTQNNTCTTAELGCSKLRLAIPTMNRLVQQLCLAFSRYVEAEQQVVMVSTCAPIHVYSLALVSRQEKLPSDDMATFSAIEMVSSGLECLNFFSSLFDLFRQGRTTSCEDLPTDHHFHLPFQAIESLCLLQPQEQRNVDDKLQISLLCHLCLHCSGSRRSL